MYLRVAVVLAARYGEAEKKVCIRYGMHFSASGVVVWHRCCCFILRRRRLLSSKAGRRSSLSFSNTTGAQKT